MSITNRSNTGFSNSGGNSASLAAEISRAIAAEASLQSQINSGGNSAPLQITSPPLSAVPEAITPQATLTEFLASTTCPILYESGVFNGKTRYQNSAFSGGFTPIGWQVYWTGTQWKAVYSSAGNSWFVSFSNSAVATPDLATWLAPGAGTGTPVFTLTPAVAGTASTSLGKLAIVTTTNSQGGYPRTFQDVWVSTVVGSTTTWTPPSHIFKDRITGLYQREYWDGGAPAYELAYP